MPRAGARGNRRQLYVHDPRRAALLITSAPAASRRAFLTRANLTTVCPCNNIPGDLYSIASDYMDAQVNFPFPGYDGVKFTVQAQNLLQQEQLNRYENRGLMPDGATYAGRTFVVGVRADY
jgi:hypothetical protein